ncbi:MAG: membrane transporter protein [Mycobacterium sp.]|nr:membrane transporter protein [Mycobacterium sp.]
MAGAAEIAIQISQFLVILGVGLTAQFADVTRVLRLPDLLARSLLSVLVVAPVIAAVLVSTMDLPPQVAIALVTLALSPLPPLLPRREGKTGRQLQYGIGLVFVLAVLAIPVIAVAAPLLGHVFGRQYVVSSWAIAQVLVISVLVPLAAGMVIRSRRPDLAERIGDPIDRLQRWALPVAIIVLVIAAAPAMWSLMGDWTLIAMVLFVGVMVAIGHTLGGPARDTSVVLAFASGCRHPATALAIASGNVANADEHGAVALYGLVTAGVGALYAYWLRRRSAMSTP